MDTGTINNKLEFSSYRELAAICNYTMLFLRLKRVLGFHVYTYTVVSSLKSHRVRKHTDTVSYLTKKMINQDG